jgi:fumarate hydratase class I
MPRKIMPHFEDSLYRLIVATSTHLPADVRRAIARAYQEETALRSKQALAIITLNIDQAFERELPICQDTGMPTFEIRGPIGIPLLQMQEALHAALARATVEGKMRPNSVDPLTGKNSGNNLGPGTPVIHFEPWERQEIEVKLLLKGGGCENKNIQYSLPTELPGLGLAGRDLEGVRKCLLQAVHQAQGLGCSAGFLGVCIGGDRASGYQHAKKQLFRSLDDTHPDPRLAALEEEIVAQANRLNIGTMGFGGQVTLLGCKIGTLNRLPASFFVSVAYNCWALRRLGVVLHPKTGEIVEWQYCDASPARMAADEGLPLTGREIVLTAPLSEEDVRRVRVGDLVLLNGPLHTGRDALHAYLMERDSPVDLRGGVIYHCGPVMHYQGGWQVKAAGPTTSLREEPYQADLIRRFGVRAVIGKGGMGAKTLAALQEYGALYLSAIGGAAQYYADCITRVDGVDFLEEFGIPEAMWHLQVQDFPAVCTMDAHGQSLHRQVEEDSARRLQGIDEEAPV